MAETAVKSVAVLIPTFKRPESLARALKSVFAQDSAYLIQEIVVVDNDAARSAHDTVEALRPCSPSPILYIHAPQPGVATARNAGLAATSASFVAFLDDDEAAHPTWLGALLHTHRQFNADVTFGPVQGCTPSAGAWKRPYLERFFSRIGPETSGLIDTVYGCGNAVMTRATALKGPEPFDVAANHTGGEDDRLFSDLKAGGARFAWAAQAVVEEHAPAYRARVTYALARAVSYGQSPSQLALRRGDFLGALKWMAIGAGQVLIYGGYSLILILMFNPAWIDMADRAARGLGKTLWFQHFHFYGDGAAKQRQATAGPIERDAAASFTASAANVTQMKSL